MAGAGLAAAPENPAVIRPAESARNFIPASDRRFRFEGRMDFTNREAPVVVWQGSQIALDFEGPRFVLRWRDATGQNFFNVQVDDRNEVMGLSAGATGEITWPHPLGAGRHRLTIFKRTEALAGQVRFAGVELETGARAWLPAAAKYKLRMEFHGDSITTGACAEDGAKDQWDDRRTHNFALTYANLTAAEFNAELRCEAVSGIGIVTGWIDVTAGEMWNRNYPRKDSALADQTWQPDVLLINLGDNDDDFPRSRQQPMPGNFTTEYIRLVQAMRRANPQAQIVLLMGGMYSSSQCVPLRQAWLAAVEQLEKTDQATSHLVFTHWTQNHPRAAEHRLLADELNAWLKVQPFMQRFL